MPVDAVALDAANTLDLIATSELLLFGTGTVDEVIVLIEDLSFAARYQRRLVRRAVKEAWVEGKRLAVNAGLIFCSS